MDGKEEGAPTLLDLNRVVHQTANISVYEGHFNGFVVLVA
jgi:hypothetical protein